VEPPVDTAAQGFRGSDALTPLYLDPLMAEPATDHRRATAERNIEAILDAAERLLERGGQPTIVAVASEAGVSRVTVYAHFATREQLLEAVVERSVQKTSEALDGVEPEQGPPLDALQRVIDIGWRELDRNNAIAQAAGELLTPEALKRTHRAAHRRLRKLIDRGCRSGEFRTDVPAEWLVSAFHALIHAAGEDVRAGRMGPGAALEALRTTLRDLFSPRSPERRR
jgi:TetR/AcrR family transcriptional regulator, mexCD-oprJ operon repressor